MSVWTPEAADPLQRPKVQRVEEPKFTDSLDALFGTGPTTQQRPLPRRQIADKHSMAFEVQPY